MDAFTTAVYDPPAEGLPTLAVVFLPEQDSILCRPTKDRSEAHTLLARLVDELTADLGEPGNA
jgi:hypothetical protein